MARRRTTLKDVAEACGVHVSTVSRALNPTTRHFIRPEVSQRILEASKQLSYKPNAAALSLRTNRTRIVGVLIPDIANPVFPPIIRGIEDALAEHGYMALLVNTDARKDRHSDRLDMLAARGVDGLLIASLEREDAAVTSLAAEGMPLVTLNRRSDDSNVASVVNDEDAGLRMILEHLKGLGHTRIANISGSQRISTGKARYEAFQRHRKALDLDGDADLVAFADALTAAEGERCARELLDRAADLTAIVATNDLLAVGTLVELKRRGLACPGDISLTGFNDMPMVDRLDPPLTTVRVRQYDVGRRAAEVLLARIESGNKAEPTHDVMPVELIVRGSTAPPSPNRRKSASSAG